MDVTVESLVRTAFDTISKQMSELPFNNFFYPVGWYSNPAEVEVITYGQTQSSGGLDIISTKGVKLRLANDSVTKNLFSITSGVLQFQNIEGVPSLILEFVDPIGEKLRKELIPAWFPIPRIAIYRNIDVSATREHLQLTLQNNPTWFSFAKRMNPSVSQSILESAFLDLFFNTSATIPITANFKIGIAGSDTDMPGNRMVELLFKEENDMTIQKYLDPCVYYLHYHTGINNDNLTSQLLYQKLTRPIAGPLIVNRLLHNVTAADILQDIINQTQPNDFITIPGGAVFTLTETLTIPHALSIIGLSNTHLCQNKETYHTVIPIQDPRPLNIEHPVITTLTTIRLLYIDKLDDGIVTVSNLTFKDGKYEYALTDFGKPEGGGAMAIEYDKVYIRNCLFENNFAISYTDDITGTEQEPEPEFLAGEYGFGGAIINFHCSSLYYGNLFFGNNTVRRGGGIGVFGYGWPLIINNIFHDNKATRSQDRADGGGVAIENGVTTENAGGAVLAFFEGETFAYTEENIAKLLDPINFQTRLFFNCFTKNLSDSGGGLYMSVCSNASLRKNIFKENMANKAGGAIRISFCCTCTLNGDQIIGNETAKIPSKREGGGGIAARTSNLYLFGVTIEANIVRKWAGGGIFFNSTTDGFVMGNARLISYNDFTLDVFKKEEYTLKINKDCLIRNNICELIASEDDRRKGGGVYIARSPNSDGFQPLPIYVTVEDMAVITNNQLTPDPDDVSGSQPVQFPESTNFHLEEFHDDTPSTLLDDSDVNGTGYYFYHSS